MLPATQKKLLVIAFMLAVLQFWVIPSLQKQAGIKEQLAQVNLQIARANAALASKDNLKALEQKLPEVISELSNDYPLLSPDMSAGQFRLNLQQHLQQGLTESGVSFEVFDWLGSSQDEQLGIEQHQARLVLRGSSERLLRAYIAVLANRADIQVQFYDLKSFSGFSSNAQQDVTLTVLLQVTVLSADFLNNMGPAE